MSRPPVRPLVGEAVLLEYLPTMFPPTFEMALFCQNGLITGDFWKREYSGDPKIRGIGRKRYNKEILSEGLGPVRIFSVMKKNPG
jgi:hypothetical protein